MGESSGARRRRTPSGPGVERINASVKPQVKRTAEGWADALGVSLSAFVEEALEERIGRLEDAERERRDRLSTRVGDLSELVDGRTRELGELVDGKTGELGELVARGTDRLAALTTLNLQAAERVYALLEAQFGEHAKIGFGEAQGIARERVADARKPKAGPSGGRGVPG